MKQGKAILAVTAMLTFLAGAALAVTQGKAQAAKQSQHTIHDSNGDGICDICGQPVGSGLSNGQGQQAKKGKHWGPGDGTGNQGSRPQDGTGYGAQSGKRSGPQDGSGSRIGQPGGQGHGTSQGQGQVRHGGRP
jgi:hypothetical protein